MKSLCRKRGFTLVEWVLLTSTLFLVLYLFLQQTQQFRQSKNTITCMSNLRQLGMAFHLYEADHQGKLPYPNIEILLGYQTAWFNALDPYLLNRDAATDTTSKNLHLIKHDPIIRRLGAAWWSNSYTLKMNLNLGLNPHDHAPRYFYSLQEIRKPSQTVLLFDGRAENNPDPSNGGPQMQAKNPQGTEGLVERRHSGRANVLFIDGHVELRIEKRQTTGTQLGWEVNQTKMIWKPWNDHPGP